MQCRIAGYKPHTMVNGPGIRFIVFFQGCHHHCDGCQNPDTWDMLGGQSVDTEFLKEKIKKTKFLDGVTLSGGDPFAQPKAAADIAEFAKENGLSVWCYTGAVYESLSKSKDADTLRLLNSIDVLVDGPFVKEKFSETCQWRGSTNQRLIDMAKTISSGHVCEY